MKNALTDIRLKGARYDQIDLVPQKLLELVFQAHELKKTWRNLKVYQDVKVTVWLLLTPHKRAKNAETLNLITFTQFWKMAAEACNWLQQCPRLS
jgi:hypothetical protein